MKQIDIKAAPAEFERIAAQIDDDPTEILDSLVPIIQDGEREQFLSQVSPSGSSWEPLAPVTVARKGFSAILIDTGRLFESVTTPNGTRDTIWETSAAGSYLVFGTDVPYARFHQTGTRKMPARPFMGISQKTERQLIDAVSDAAVKRLVKE